MFIENCMHRLLAAGLAALLLLASCERSAPGGRDTIDLVKTIASDIDAPEYALLSGFQKPAAGGDICIIGTAETCRRLGDAFLRCDMFENARGMNWSDGLKDFAGEEFAFIVDDTFTPYQGFVAEHGEQSLREAAVRMSLAALKNNCNISIYDLDGNQEKNPAKMIILADPWLFRDGKFDIDTLFTLTGCGVPVLSPQELMFDEVLGKGKKAFNMAVLCDSCFVGTGLYPGFFESKVKQYDVVGAHCFEAPTDLDGGLLVRLLDKYVEAGGTQPLDALLVDDLKVDMIGLRAELNAIRDYSKEESMRYGKLISPDFKLVSSTTVTMTACYREFREKSLFTHRIAQPVSREYNIKPRLDGNIMQFLLIPSENVQN